jgi:hypothetical protein
MNGTSSRSCPVAYFGVGDVELSGSDCLTLMSL